MQLIFIHGSGSTKESFHYQTEHFKASIALDLPGHPDGNLCSSIDGYTDWLHDYVKEKGLNDVILVGHSLGGGICLNYALKYPGELKGQILIGSGLKLRVHPMFLEAFEKAIAEPDIFGEMINPAYSLIDPKLAKGLKQRALENGPAAMLNDMQACDKFDILGREKEINLPTLAICGSDDVMTPPKYSHFVADNISDARMVIIDGGTHFVFAEKPKEVNQAIENFISEL